MNSIINDHKSIGKLANLKALEGRPQNDPTAIHKAPEPQEHDWSGMYWAGHGQRWVQDASGKWVTEEAVDNDLSAAG